MNASLTLRRLSRAFAVLLASVASGQTTHYVDVSACPTAGTGTELDPFCAIQSAIDAAQSGDLILVAPGDYTAFPNTVVDFSGKDVVVRSTHGPSQTKLSYGSPVVRFANGEQSGAVLEGFTVTRGGTHGIQISGASPTIRGNVITKNNGSAGGSGVRISAGASPLFEDNEVRSNSCAPPSGDGGGFYIENSSALLVRNQIVSNHVFADYGRSHGAGLFIRSSTVGLIGNLVAGNMATDEARNHGGGLYAFESTLDLQGNTFADNYAADADPFIGTPGTGGGMYLENSPTTISDSIYWGNLATDGTDIAAFGSTLGMAYTDLGVPLYGSTAITTGPGNLAVDPLLSASYRLTSSSPAIDVGDPAASAVSSIDGDIDPRVLDGDLDGAQRLDMGWDEYNPTTLAVVGTATPGGSLMFQVDAPPGWNFALAYSTGVQGIVAAPFGSILIDPSQLVLFGAGAVPGVTNVNIPGGPSLLGIEFHVQAFARNPGPKIGSFSRRVSLRVQ